MRRAAPRLIRTLACVVALAGCSGAGESAVPLTDTTVAEIRRLHETYAAAWISDDPEAVMTCFTTDAVLIPHHGAAIVRGETAIREFFWPESAEPVVVTEFTLSPDEIEGFADLAFARGRFQLSLRTRHDADVRAYSSAGNYMMILRRDPEAWRVARYIWNDPPPTTQ